eukprot:4806962-Pleurochrysis_carterae.AAC.2
MSSNSDRRGRASPCRRLLCRLVPLAPPLPRALLGVVGRQRGCRRRAAHSVDGCRARRGSPRRCCAPSPGRRPAPAAPWRYLERRAPRARAPPHRLPAQALEKLPKQAQLPLQR